MAIQKELTQPGVSGPYRNRSVAENLSLFEAMKNGDYPERKPCFTCKNRYVID
jgi:glutaminyl-tRNA synthetase